MTKKISKKFHNFFQNDSIVINGLFSQFFEKKMTSNFRYV